MIHYVFAKSLSLQYITPVQPSGYLCMEIFCALAGVLFAYTWHPFILIGLCILLILRLRFIYVACFLSACLWALMHQWWVLPQSLPQHSDPAHIELKGSVVSSPQVTEHRTRFQFAVHELDGIKQSFLVQLSWYQKAPLMHLGENWKLVVQLKKPRNLKNPGAFDYERSMQAKHIAWIGYVRSGTKLSGMNTSLSLKSLQLREKWGSKLNTLAPDPVTSSIVQALTLGLTGQISQDNWTLFRQTGTTHLMVISGAHIGLVAGLVFGLINQLWRRHYYACLFSPALRIASLSSVAAALIYALIAGFAVPAQRSFLACGFAFFRYVGHQRFSGWQGWRYGLLFALLFEPHAVLLPGFYLSFMAVAILILVQQRWPQTGWKQMLSAQTACLLGLMPFSLYWFSYASMNGFFANLIAIPLVGFLLVPLSLLSLLFLHTPLALPLMKLCALLVALLMKILHFTERFSFINLQYTFQNVWMPFSIMSGMLLCTLLPHRTFMLPGFLLTLSAIFPSWPAVKPQQVHIRILDVGQGLSVLIQTAKHQLLYDAGDAFPGGSDMGKMAIIPAMHALGIHDLDKIVISHQDRDHYGGLRSVEPLLKGDLIVNDPGYYRRGYSCHDYPAWIWDGVTFQFLAIKNHFTDKNNTSCILKISAGDQHMLLTGDIEKAAEQYLVDTWKDQISTNVLLLAHHGSKTSSSPRFMQQVAPQYAIISTGLNNRYHFPHPATVDICKRMHIPLYNTADKGMISIQLGAKDIVIK